MPLPTIPSGNVASATASTSFDVDNSSRWDNASSMKMTRTPSSTGNSKTWTFSMWIKIGQIGTEYVLFHNYGSSGTSEVFVKLLSGGTIEFSLRYDGTYEGRLITNRLFRDCTSWMHLVFVCDTTSSTATNRQRIYVNGVEETSFSTDTHISQDAGTVFNQSFEHTIGSYGSGNYFDGYMAEVVMLDGTAAAVTDFGEFNSDSPTIWQPKDVSGLTFGTAGFYLDFKDSSNLGNNANGGQDWTEVNFAANDQMIDTPTNNFPTFNPLVTAGADDGSVYTMTYREGNLQGATMGAQGPLTQIIPNQGKWFCELHFNHATADSDPGTIVCTLTSLQNHHWYQSGHIGIVFKWHGDIYENGSDSGTNSDAYTTNDIISLAINRDANPITLYKNGSVMTNANARSFSNLGNYDDFVIAYQDGANSSTYDTLCDLNAGQNGTFNGRKTAGGNADGNGYGNFSMAVPSGYYSLCSKNIAEFG